MHTGEKKKKRKEGQRENNDRFCRSLFFFPPIRSREPTGPTCIKTKRSKAHVPDGKTWPGGLPLFLPRSLSFDGWTGRRRRRAGRKKRRSEGASIAAAYTSACRYARGRGGKRTLRAKIRRACVLILRRTVASGAPTKNQERRRSFAPFFSFFFLFPFEIPDVGVISCLERTRRLASSFFFFFSAHFFLSFSFLA